jgi:hypothetical protein
MHYLEGLASVLETENAQLIGLVLCMGSVS